MENKEFEFGTYYHDGKMNFVYAYKERTTTQGIYSFYKLTYNKATATIDTSLVNLTTTQPLFLELSKYWLQKGDKFTYDGQVHEVVQIYTKEDRGSSELMVLSKTLDKKQHNNPVFVISNLAEFIW